MAIPTGSRTASEEAAALNALATNLQSLSATFQASSNPAAQTLLDYAAVASGVSGWLALLPANSKPSDLNPAVAPIVPKPMPIVPTQPATGVTATPSSTTVVAAVIGLAVGAAGGFALGRKR